MKLKKTLSTFKESISENNCFFRMINLLIFILLTNKKNSRQINEYHIEW